MLPWYHWIQVKSCYGRIARIWWKLVGFLNLLNKTVFFKCFILNKIVDIVFVLGQFLGFCDFIVLFHIVDFISM